MDMIVESMPYIMKYSFLRNSRQPYTIHHKTFDRRWVFENKGMPPPADYLLAQMGKFPSSSQLFPFLQPPVSVPMVSTIFDEEIAHRITLPL